MLNDYYATHKLHKECTIQPMAVDSVAFLPDNTALKSFKKALEKDRSAIVYDIDYNTMSGKHFSSSKNISKNLKWRYN